MTATDSADVLRCTFCGSANFRRPMQDPWQKWIIGCVDCGAEGPQADSPSEAIAAWNRRAESADDALLREARDALDGVLTGMGLRPVGAGDGCHTVTVTIPSADQMNAATRALKALNAAQGQKP